jgi:hypothetical protein
MEETPMQSLLSKVELIGDVDPKAGGPLVIIDVIMKTGEKYQAKAPVAASGDLDKNPISEGQIIGKYYENVEFGGTTSRENAEKALDFIMDMEKKSDIAPLIALFV